MGARAKAVYRGDGGQVHYLSSSPESSLLIITDPAVGMTKIPFDGPCRLIPRSPSLPAGYDAVDYQSIGVEGSTLVSVRAGERPFEHRIAGVCDSCMDGPHDYSLWPVCPMGDRVSYGQHDGEVREVYRVTSPRPEPVEEAEPAVERVSEPVPDPTPEPVAEPASVVDEQLQESARQLGLRVWDGGGKPWHQLFAGMSAAASGELLNAAVAKQWVRVGAGDVVVPGTVSPRAVESVGEPLSLRERIVRWGSGPGGGW